MSNSKISGLTSATTPLVGTEVLPVVQSGATKQVSVDNLTAGRSIAASGLAVDANSSSAAVRITQLGAGNALLVEDAASPDATPFVIDASGNTVVGSTTAYATVDSSNTARTPLLQNNGLSQSTAHTAVFNWSASTGSAAYLSLNKSKSGVVGTQTAVAVNDDIGAFNFAASDGTAFVTAANILAEVDGTPGTNDMPGRLVFSTTADGASTPTERVRIASDGLVTLASTSGLSIGRTAVTAPATTDGNVFSGTYTPTLTNTTNVASSTAVACQYMRVGNVVTVSGYVTIDPTLAITDTVLDMSLPVASNLGSARQVGGTAWLNATGVGVQWGAVIYGNSTGDTARFGLYPASASALAYSFSFTYLVI
jgi:hypothetical protein